MPVFYFFFTASKQGKTGLTVAVDVYNGSTGALLAADQAATEIGGGLYKLSYNSTAVDLLAKAKTTDSSVDLQHVAALVSNEQQLIDAAISTRATSASVWAYAVRTLTQTAATIAAALAGSEITAWRGDTLRVSLTGLGNLSGRSKLWFCVKRSRNDSDSAAVLLIEETAGLTVVNGATYATTTDGSITVTDAETGAVDIVIKPAVTALLDGVGMAYDVQMLTDTSVTTLTDGVFGVSRDVTRAVS